REFPQYTHYFSIPAIDFGNGKKIQLNSNNLIGRFDGIDGMKTGFICASGFNLVASATRNKRTIIVVILGSESINKREEKAAQLLDAGFSDKGSPQSTLATLEPYGTKMSQITDMRQKICTPEAIKMRLDSYDEEGNIILTSPLITALPSPILPLQVKLISAPKTLKINGKIVRKIPIPYKRPPYSPPMIKAVNHI
ncbi:MAG: D-alanyl-D-alanine carboxypeptidase, partial [Bartonella sp.]|nr:D-alanyl-D-alanine carboxypeptidase [Bartonella sp.]